MAEAQEQTVECDPLWYKDAIIYQLHVKAFFDANDDGTGDFEGLTRRLDYVQDLGVNTLWLLPFYPSPLRDDGYDIADYRNIHTDYGSRRDFRHFVREAHRRGLRVVTELVINHTSDQHPWFQAARRAPAGSAKRSFYVWSDSDQKFPETRIIFTDTESSNWAWDPLAQQYYWHRFFSHQPDLNLNNPQVVKALLHVMRFWLDMGVDGLRLDAIPYLCVREGTNNENLPETHAVIRQMRKVVDEHYRCRMFLAEANQWPEDVRDYFGEGDECHMAYHFPLMPRIYMAVAQEDRHPIVEIMGQTPEIPDNCQWAVFLRNHDELTLEMVTDSERDYMYGIYAADKRMRLNLGIRRRLAPLMQNDPDKIKLMNSLLMSMPGSPIIYYGDEIGMGDNFFLGDRNGVRTPMQWSPDRNAGFSRADPQRLYLPPVMDPIYGYQAVNVEAQSRDPSSLLNWMKRIIAVRKAHQAFGRGALQFLSPGNRKILAYLRSYGEETILCVANLSHTAQPVELALAAYRGRVPVEMMGHIPFPPVGDLPYLLTLAAYGVYWFLLAEEADVPAWHSEHLPPLELPVLVLFRGWLSLFPDQVEPNRRRNAEQLRRQLASEVLPAFLPTQRWFGAKGVAIETVELVQTTEWTEGNLRWLIAWVRVHSENTAPELYFLPLALLWLENDEEIWHLLHHTLAKIRQQARLGILCDAFTDARFCRALVDAMAVGRELEVPGGRLRFSATAALAPLLEGLEPETTIRHPGVEGSNTAVIIGDRLFLKGYRRLQEGINPELEIGRFLTETSPYGHVIPVAGALEYLPEQGEPMTLALLQSYVDNQGDAWSHTVGYLERCLEQYRVAPTAEEVPVEEHHAAELMLMRTLGQRSGEMHQALCRSTGDPAFDPEPITAKEFTALFEGMRRDVLDTLKHLRQVRTLASPARELAEAVLGAKPALLRRVGALRRSGIRASKSRLHGDYHLGQVLLTGTDFVIIDFEGEPARPLAERRQKGSPLRDVAGMLRSLNYAAYAALYRATAERPEDRSALEPYVHQWYLAAREAFLDGYREAIAGCATYPEVPEEAQSLLDLFTLQKALYELRYELDNRPDWAAIPLRGLLVLAAGAD